VTEAFSSSVGPASIASVTRQKGIALLVKRVFDVVGASIALVVLFPLLVLAAIAVKVDSPGPVLFHQRRVGRNGRHFTIHKFRSMVADADPAVHQARNTSKLKPPGLKSTTRLKTTIASLGSEISSGGSASMSCPSCGT